MTRPQRIVLLSGALVVVLVVLALLGGGTRNRGSLQRYKAELRARGEKLTFDELLRSRSTNVVNTMTPLSTAVLTLGDARFLPTPVEGRKYVSPGRARVGWGGDYPSWLSTNSASARPTWADLAAEMADAQPALAEIRRALQDPAANAGPCTNMLTGPGSSFATIRSVAQWLAAAALNETHQGHVEPALQDLEAIAALAQLDREEYTLVAQAIRVAVTRLGLEASWDVLQAPGWTEPQLARLQRAWEAVHPVEGIERAFVGERAYGEELWRLTRKYGWRKATQSAGLSVSPKASIKGFFADCACFPLYRLTSMNADELFHLKASEEALTGLRELVAHRPWKEAKPHIDQPTAWFNQLSSSPGRFRYSGTLMIFPNNQRITSIAVRAETERELTLAAIALKRYQLRNGELPANLAALTPKLLPTSTHDPMSGKSLCYRLKPDGSFLLYSVGEDGKDDGGDATSASGTAFGLWEGRDVVWPTAAEQER
jgi:hypothetical protein